MGRVRGGKSGGRIADAFRMTLPDRPRRSIDVLCDDAPPAAPKLWLGRLAEALIFTGVGVGLLVALVA